MINEERRARVVDAAWRELPGLRGSAVVLAVSGGADSAALVAWLCDADLIDRSRAIIAHFDHRLRDEDSARRDVSIVQALAHRFALDAEFGAWTDPQRSEAAARAARYDFLREVARARGSHAVITGHTADDQAETVLMHAMRGAGLHGLAGMTPDAPWPSGHPALRVWRPLLNIWRAETRAYCDATGIEYSDDATNDDRGYARNRVRLDLLPQMERAVPDMKQRLLELARGARDTARALDAIAAPAIIDAPLVAGVLALDRPRLAALPAEAAPHAFRLAIVRLLGDARDFERKHYATLVGAVRGRTGSTYELPRGVVATVDASRIVLSVGLPALPPVDANIEHDLPFKGVAGAWKLRITPAAEATMADGGIDLRLPAGAVVRARRPGDRVSLRVGSKKLADWYIDRKIPRRERTGAPVIAYGNQVLWTPWGALGELPHGAPWRIAWARADAGRPGAGSGKSGV